MKKILNYIINISEIRRTNKEINALELKYRTICVHLVLAKHTSELYKKSILDDLTTNKNKVNLLKRKLRMLKNGL